MDNFVVMTDELAEIEAIRGAIAQWLERERDLKLKDPAAPVRSITQEVLYLGQRVSRAGWRPRRAALHRFEQRTRKMVLRGDVEAVVNLCQPLSGNSVARGSAPGTLTTRRQARSRSPR